ncbi:hypothetical protein [Novosphingobium rosa]|uniref:hypothetical protein n=1 Tax=Novosphingobium rosa TaxID=76978 RepID=UPI000832C8F5|nr:hypothetical protein [Novosphingobium rosa]
MTMLHAIAWFFGGATLTNAMPHLISGLMGRAFQSPFASPPGEGLSSATVNVLWGFTNLAMAYGLLCHVGSFDLRQPLDALVCGLGGLALGLFTARHFGRFHGGDLR